MLDIVHCGAILLSKASLLSRLLNQDMDKLEESSLPILYNNDTKFKPLGLPQSELGGKGLGISKKLSSTESHASRFEAFGLGQLDTFKLILCLKYAHYTQTKYVGSIKKIGS